MDQQAPGSSSGPSGADSKDYREWRRDRKKYREPMRGLFWGLALILLGVLFFATSQNWISWDRWWQYLLIGLGAIFLIDAWVQYTNPATRFGTLGRLVSGIILITIGGSFLIGIENWWPLILIILGIGILVNFAMHRH
jgi:hypothetical protein